MIMVTGIVSVLGILSAFPYMRKKPKITIKEDTARIFLAKNGTPQQNISKIIEMIGGIETIIGKKDIVVLKPNAQWWNQGMTNLAAIKGFIDLVLGIPGFEGEIIIAENHHFMDDSLPDGEKDNIRGWVYENEINGDIDGVNYILNGLVEFYNKNGHPNVTKYHLRDGGPNKNPRWHNAHDGGIVSGPAEGDGYVWTDIEYVYRPLHTWWVKKWVVKMTYPIFTSSYSNITIDLKNGAFQRDSKGGGSYLKDRSVKLINFSVLNDHPDTGVTASVKNLMGIVDLSCGEPDLKGYYDIHDCGKINLHNGRGIFFYRYAKAGPLGHFMKTIRKADLNIITAEWVGYEDRTDPKKASNTKTILAGTDPIALDYYACKHIMLPLGGKNADEHDPDSSSSSIRKFLLLAQESAGEFTMDENKIKISSYDYLKNNQ